MALRDIIEARNRRRRDLRHPLQDRSRTVEGLLEAHRGGALVNAPLGTNDLPCPAETNTARVDTPRLKRYFNE
jgi:hypothetical protein